MLLIAAGRRTGEIAAELNLSAKTVSTYKRRVLNKLGLTSTSDLVRYVISPQARLMRLWQTGVKASSPSCWYSMDR